MTSSRDSVDIQGSVSPSRDWAEESIEIGGVEWIPLNVDSSQNVPPPTREIEVESEEIPPGTERGIQNMQTESNEDLLAMPTVSELMNQSPLPMDPDVRDSSFAIVEREVMDIARGLHEVLSQTSPFVEIIQNREATRSPRARSEDRSELRPPRQYTIDLEQREVTAVHQLHAERDRTMSNVYEIDPLRSEREHILRVFCPSNRPNITDGQLAQIPSSVLSSEQAKELVSCSVCLEEYNEGDTIKHLQCKHDFHSDCIIQWARQHNTCPVCRGVAVQQIRNRPNQSDYLTDDGADFSRAYHL